MNMSKRNSIPPDGRLTIMADMIIKNQAIADIGTDHTLLPIYMLEKELIPHAIVTEIIAGPYQRAKKAVKASSFSERIEVRKGNGLDTVQPSEVASIIIAGMGGDTIAEIISRDWDKSSSFSRFILQPMSRPHVVRGLLATRGWTINEERLVLENNRFFVILSYSPANKPYKLTSLQEDIGPQLLKKDYIYKGEYLNHFLLKYKKVYEKLMASEGSTVESRITEYKDKILKLEEIINEIKPD
ncbi:MAG TPA: class I SAM-dependent methyltransferase [Syntrophomonadaceae bacterium]|nr:class I SAM-dependent methyltransferase [Syntrophomonadaceae bacterium]